MLPVCRTVFDPYAVPKFNISSADVTGFLSELKVFHDCFKDFFARSETRETLFHYMAGQFSHMERKSIEPIALKAKDKNKNRSLDAKVRAMQRSISDAYWNENQILLSYRNMVREDMGYPEGVVIFDESGFVKKGNDSVAVTRQYCGNIGKVENCQIGVFAAYVSPYGYSLVDKRLFIPEKWFSPEYQERRDKCKLPPEITSCSKPQLAADMFHALKEEKILPFRYVVADTLYGNSPDFMQAVSEDSSLIYMVSTPSDTLCWIREPIIIQKTYRYGGELRVKENLEHTEKKPIAVKELMQTIHSYFWYKRTVSEGTKGPIEYDFTCKKITLSHKGLPTESVWLIIKRTLGESPDYSYYISNAPEDTHLGLFVWLSGMRWAIEQCFEETKTELGMDHYELRKFPGWHHHMLSCMLGHFFLWNMKLKMEKKSSCFYFIPSQIVAGNSSPYSKI